MQPASDRPAVRLRRARLWRRAAVGALAVALALGAGALPGGAAGPAQTGDLLPDLRMLPPTEIRVRVEGGERRLRFTTAFVNVGAGPFEVRGSRPCSALARCPRMSVVQRIARAGGGSRKVATRARMRLDVGDGHGHWHVVGMERFVLYDVTQPGGGTPRPARKYGFCFFDTRPYRLGLPGASPWRRFVENGPRPGEGCAGSSDLTSRMGLSVGWQDIYPWHFAGQWIGLRGVRDGVHLLCVTADPDRRFLESKPWNNQAWARLRIAGGAVRVLATGQGPCADVLPAPDPVPSPTPAATPG